MFHYFSTLTDDKGNSLPGYQVEVVQLADGQTVVPIFSDENETPIQTVSGVANRALSDAAGNYDFFVEDGTYSLRFYDAEGGFLKTQRYLPFYGAPSGGGGGDIAIEQDGSAIVAEASAVNFTGSVAVTDGGNGKANVVIAGGGLARGSTITSDGSSSYALELGLPVSIVTLDGLAQPEAAFSVAGQVITFAESVPSGTLIDVYYGDSSGGDVVPSIVVNSIAVIEALSDPTAGDAVYLNAGGRSGWFNFDASDLSSEVSSDTAQGIYIAPDSDATGASGAWVRQYEGAAFPEWFGAVGDGVADDTSAVQAAFDTINGNGGGSIKFGGRPQYSITDTVTLQDGNDLDMNGSELLYVGTRDRPALVIGSAGSANNYADLRKIAVRSSAIDWANPDFVGLRLINLQRSNISISVASSFHTGIEIYAEDGYCAYNQIFVDAMSACKHSQQLKTVGSGGLTFINENTFYGGSFLQTSSTNGLGDAYGVVITWDKLSSYRRQNNNVWIRPSFELLYPTAGGSVRDCVLFDGAGEECRFIECRRENSGRAMNINSDNSSYGRNNTFTSSFDESNQSGDAIAYTGTRGTGNVYLGENPQSRFFSEWSAPNLVDYFSSGGAANSYHVAEPFHACSSANGDPVSQFTSSNLDLDADSVRAKNASSFGFFIDTDVAKTFVLRLNLVNDQGCRIYLRPFDESGALLNDSGLTNGYVNGIVTTWGSSFGGGYTISADTVKAGTVTVNGDVKSLQVILIGGPSVAMLLRGVSVTALNTVQPVRVYSGLSRQPNTRRATAKPDIAGTIGRYNRGDFIANADAAAASTPGWIATNDGRLARPWQSSTAYDLGQVRANDIDKIYVCVSAGTSAGSGGPTGTGAGIADGTAEWDYVSPRSTFATMPNLT